MNLQIIKKICYSVILILLFSSCSQSYRSTYKLVKNLSQDSISKIELSIFQKYDTTIFINDKKIIRNLYTKDTILIDIEKNKFINNEVYDLIHSIIDTIESNNYSPFYDFTDYKSITDSILIEELKINENLFLSNEISKFNILMSFINKKTNEEFYISIHDHRFEISFSVPKEVIHKNLMEIPLTLLKIVVLPLTLIPMRRYSNYYSDWYKLPRIKFEEKMNNLVKKIVKYHNSNLYSLNKKVKWYDE